MASILISREKQWFGVGLIGGPTVVIDYGGLRLVTDPTFDPPADATPISKLEGPAVTPDVLGRADCVLLSHDQHGDNLDRGGRAYTLTAERILTGPGAADRLGGQAIGLRTWHTGSLTRPDGSTVTVTALPAVHGPIDGNRDESGHVNCEVTGFLLTSEKLPTVYVSGDNASIEVAAEIAAQTQSIDIAVLFAGAARTPIKDRGRPLTLTAQRAADATLLLGASQVIPAHYRGWSLYSETPDDLVGAFDDAGISERLRLEEPGTWTITESRPGPA
jgi:L-ascorbate metabolism protein UlaG (beta-lactamase superfamily)